jgi:hypothetical protein
MERDGKMLNGITLCIKEYEIGWTDPDLGPPTPDHEYEARFDVISEDSRKQRKCIHHNHLDNYFNCYVLDLTRHTNPPILESLFVAEGKYAGFSLQDILNKNDDEACAKAGSPLNVLDDKLNRTEVTTETTAATTETTSIATVTTTSTETTATNASLYEIYNRLRAKYAILKKELELITLIEAQIKAIKELKDEIAHKRKIIENPECQ